MSLYLGLDASTSTIGIALLQSNPLSLVALDFYKPPKKGTLFERMNAAREAVWKVIDGYSPDAVILEDIISFMPGKSSASTMLLLSAWNRMIGLAAFDKGKPPILLNVCSVRHALKEGKTIPKKEDLPELLARKLNLPSFPYAFLSKGKNKGKVAPESLDMSDALALALAYAQKTR